MSAARDYGTVALLYLERQGTRRENRRQSSERVPLNWVLVVAVAAFLLPSSTAEIKTKEIRRVLVFYELGLSSPAVELLDRQIQSALQKSPFQIELYREYLETTLFPDPSTQQEFREGYIHKYRDRKPDLILALGRSPLRFILDVHEKHFLDIPVVFGGAEEALGGYPQLDRHFTGVWERFEPARTLEVALRLLPRTRNVMVVGGTSDFDRRLEALFKGKLHAYEDRFNFTYLTDLDMTTLLQRVQSLPENTVILYTHIGQDATGTRFVGASQADPLVASVANAPMFGPSDVDLGHGEVGGDLVSFAEEGKIVGDMALRILNGESPQNIPIASGSNVYMFDWQALRRWGLKEKGLPPGSIVLNRKPSIWESYKSYVIGGVSLILLQTLLIFSLLWQRAKRRKAESELSVTYDRLRLAAQAGKFVGWDWDVKSGSDRWFGDLESMFGIPSDDFQGHIDDFRNFVYPDDREIIWKAVADARRNHKAYNTEYRIVRLDGSVRWIAAWGRFYYARGGDPERMLGMAVDITERKSMEQKVRESEERFRLVASTAPVMIWMAGTDKLCNYFNQPWLEFSGRPIEVELGNGWAEGVYPEDVKSCWDSYAQAFDRRESFKIEYRLRRHDGEYRWVSDTGVPRFNPDGSFAGYIGSCIDITDRKQAEETLADVGRRLIEAHEEERTWIARELHDDINQRIALLAIELERLQQKLPASAVAPSSQIHKIRQQLWDLGKDVQALSHRLHSSKLDYLGIVAAARGFCRELSDQQKVEIDFHHMGVPNELPKEVSLCLFRVLQEALQNAVKHSGVRHFRVELLGDPGEIQLTVSDLGGGFEEQEAINRRGLGLISMRERLQFVNGEFAIKSHVGQGTTITARVPLRTDKHRTSIAG